MFRTVLAAMATLAPLTIAAPAMASEFERVQERDSFVSLVKGRNLTRLGIRLQVSQDGDIKGRAFGKDISGDWTWDEGYFCRDLFADGDVLDIKNCQTVEVRGNTLRFTSDKGTGDSANLRLK
ncbi:MAG: dihydrodipicolinate reductase [Pseudomonadota bacterium]